MFTATGVSIQSESALDADEIILSRRLAKQWQLRKGDSLTLFFGLTDAAVNISSIDGKENVLLCHPALLEHLRLLPDSLLRSGYFPSKRELVLGPVIALLTEIKEMDNGPSFGNVAAFCEELAAFSEQMGCFFYVTSLSLWDDDDVEGYRFENGAWLKESMPFPNIVHNRVHSRRAEQSTRFLNWLKHMKARGIPHFNDRFLNKWEVHELLQGFPYLKPYIPETALLQTKQELADMLASHSCLFLKPIYGSQGRNILRVTRDEAGYLLDYTTFTGDVQRSYTSLDELFRTIKRLTGQRSYLMQQGLSLYRYKQRPLDFRILCHKTPEHRWKVTSSIARVSAEKQFVSNAALGGSLHRPEEVLQPAFSSKEARHIKKLLGELAIEVAKCISLSYDGLYGELGIDMAVDEHGNPWFIEANSKPSKNMMPQTAGPAIRPSVRSILQYCCAAAAQPSKEV
ncbi:YheC/YheD family endospore coat-associated protein [Ectobacillus ponti]|uniref:YheC/YheD family protein n=1 Tax=Ectobacillus ponti TaxID=2961894 RepID=A0AA41X6N2_9BACI|nr:YheC/YheD family protein [Ectobacillus ponti]MCP8968178.1 YheC/YheD family protein [Ectobacillus ponti]